MMVTTVIDLRLDPRREAVPRARAALDALRGIASSAAIEDSRLLVSELITNSIRHGELTSGQPIRFRVDVAGGSLRVEVRDTGRGFVLSPRTSESVDDSGWGLYLVSKIAERWGMSSDGGTTVWLEIPLDRGRDQGPP
jgi:anti-sigma regulatory factor (Ser/Thr protein kinase)